MDVNVLWSVENMTVCLCVCIVAWCYCSPGSPLQFWAWQLCGDQNAQHHNFNCLFQGYNYDRESVRRVNGWDCIMSMTSPHEWSKTKCVFEWSKVRERVVTVTSLSELKECKSIYCFQSWTSFPSRLPSSFLCDPEEPIKKKKKETAERIWRHIFRCLP